MKRILKNLNILSPNKIKLRKMKKIEFHQNFPDSQKEYS